MENDNYNLLKRWISFGNISHSSELETVFTDIHNMKTGPKVDESVPLLSRADSVQVLLECKKGVNGKNAFVKCEGYIVDVPSDGDCGYNAVANAASMYDSQLAENESLKPSGSKVRDIFVDFLKSRRCDIERQVKGFLGTCLAGSYLWSDELDSDSTTFPKKDSGNPTFEEFCEQTLLSGINGHWLGTSFGAFEAHLLGRAFSVLVYITSATSDGSLRQTQAPMHFLWKGSLACKAKGAVVIRFLGSYNRGHYQFLLPGRRTKEIILKSKRRLLDDVAIISGMHGVQPATKKRYMKDYRIVDEAFKKMKLEGMNPLLLEQYGSKVIEVLKSILMQRCGPKSRGYEGLKCTSTGNVLLASVATWYKNSGVSFGDSQSCIECGSAVRGPPWKARSLLDFKDSLAKAQAKSKAHPVKRAYQLTHDDVAASIRRFVASQLSLCLDCKFNPAQNPKVDWLGFQTSLMVCASFGSGCRGAEIVSISVSDLSFSSDGIDTNVVADVYGIKSKSGSKAVKKVIFPNWKETSVINPALAILIQLYVVHRDASLESNGPLFPDIHRNQVLYGKFMSPDVYSLNVKNIFLSLGITDSATEHSPRRGGLGFRYFVLGETLDYIRDIVGHVDLKETITYIGLHDPNNSYVTQGYGTCAAKPLR